MELCDGNMWTGFKLLFSALASPLPCSREIMAAVPPIAAFSQGDITNPVFKMTVPGMVCCGVLASSKAVSLDLLGHDKSFSDLLSSQLIACLDCSNAQRGATVHRSLLLPWPSIEIEFLKPCKIFVGNKQGCFVVNFK